MSAPKVLTADGALDYSQASFPETITSSFSEKSDATKQSRTRPELTNEQSKLLLKIFESGLSHTVLLKILQSKERNSEDSRAEQQDFLTLDITPRGKSSTHDTQINPFANHKETTARRSRNVGIFVKPEMVSVAVQTEGIHQITALP